MDEGLSVLAEAEEIIRTVRQDWYGSPRDNHECTAAMWSAYLSRRMRMPVTLTPRDVCHCMSLMKISRDAHLPMRDNLVDVVGWTANIEMAEADPAAPRHAGNNGTGEPERQSGSSRLAT